MEKEKLEDKKVDCESDKTLVKISDPEALEKGHENSTMSSNTDDNVIDNDSPKGVATTSNSTIDTNLHGVNETEEAVKTDKVVEIDEEIKLENEENNIPSNQTDDIVSNDVNNTDNVAEATSPTSGPSPFEGKMVDTIFSTDDGDCDGDFGAIVFTAEVESNVVKEVNEGKEKERRNQKEEVTIVKEIKEADVNVDLEDSALEVENDRELCSISKSCTETEEIVQATVEVGVEDEVIAPALEKKIEALEEVTVDGLSSDLSSTPAPVPVASSTSTPSPLVPPAANDASSLFGGTNTYTPTFDTIPSTNSINGKKKSPVVTPAITASDSLFGGSSPSAAQTSTILPRANSISKKVQAKVVTGASPFDMAPSVPEFASQTAAILSSTTAIDSLSPFDIKPTSGTTSTISNTTTSTISISGTDTFPSLRGKSTDVAAAEALFASPVAAGGMTARSQIPKNSTADDVFMAAAPITEEKVVVKDNAGNDLPMAPGVRVAPSPNISTTPNSSATGVRKGLTTAFNGDSTSAAFASLDGKMGVTVSATTTPTVTSKRTGISKSAIDPDTAKKVESGELIATPHGLVKAPSKPQLKPKMKEKDAVAEISQSALNGVHGQASLVEVNATPQIPTSAQDTLIKASSNKTSSLRASKVTNETESSSHHSESKDSSTNDAKATDAPASSKPKANPALPALPPGALPLPGGGFYFPKEKEEVKKKPVSKKATVPPKKKGPSVADLQRLAAANATLSKPSESISTTNDGSVQQVGMVGGSVDPMSNKIARSDVSDSHLNTNHVTMSKQAIEIEKIKAEVLANQDPNRPPHGRPACPIISFAFGGKLVTMFPKTTASYDIMDINPDSAPQGPQAGPIQIYNTNDIIHDGNVTENEEKIDGISKWQRTKRLLRGFDNLPLYSHDESTFQRIKSFTRDLYKDGDDDTQLPMLKLLVQVLMKLCYSTLENNNEEETTKLISELLIKNGASLDTSDEVAQHFANMTGAIDTDKTGATMVEAQRLLLQGRREEALDAACSGGQWALAMVIASVCGAQVYRDVIRRYVDATMPSKSPLQLLCILYSGASLSDGDINDLASTIDTNSIDVINTLHTLVSNRTTSGHGTMTKLGNSILSRISSEDHNNDGDDNDRNSICLAHICHLLGGSLPSFSSTATSFKLLGYEDKSNGGIFDFNSIPVLEAIRLTEIFEWSLGDICLLNTGTNTSITTSQDPVKEARALYCGMILCPIKLRMLMALLDMGPVDQVVKYLVHMRKLLNKVDFYLKLGKMPMENRPGESHQRAVMNTAVNLGLRRDKLSTQFMTALDEFCRRVGSLPDAVSYRPQLLSEIDKRNIALAGQKQKQRSILQSHSGKLPQSGTNPAAYAAVNSAASAAANGGSGILGWAASIGAKHLQALVEAPDSNNGSPVAPNQAQGHIQTTPAGIPIIPMEALAQGGRDTSGGAGGLMGYGNLDLSTMPQQHGQIADLQQGGSTSGLQTADLRDFQDQYGESVDASFGGGDDFLNTNNARNLPETGIHAVRVNPGALHGLSAHSAVESSSNNLAQLPLGGQDVTGSSSVAGVGLGMEQFVGASASAIAAQMQSGLTAMATTSSNTMGQVYEGFYSQDDPAKLPSASDLNDQNSNDNLYGETEEDCSHQQGVGTGMSMGIGMGLYNNNSTTTYEGFYDTPVAGVATTGATTSAHIVDGMSDFAPNVNMDMNYNNNVNNHPNDKNTTNNYNNQAYQGFYSHDETSQGYEQQQPHTGYGGESDMQRELMAPLASTGGVNGMDSYNTGDYSNHGNPDAQNLHAQAQGHRQGLGDGGLLDRADSSGALSISSNEGSTSSTGIVRNLRKSVTSWFYPDAHDAEDNMGSKLEAYFDKHTGKWVFPDDDSGGISNPAAAPPPMGMGGSQPMSMSMSMGMNQVNQGPIAMAGMCNTGATNMSSMTGANSSVPSQQFPVQNGTGLGGVVSTGPPGVGMDINTTTQSQDLDPLAALMAPPPASLMRAATANIASNMDINAGPPGNGLLSNGGTQSITTAAKGDVSPAEAVAPKPMVWKPPPAPKPAAVTAPVAEGNDTTTTNNGTKDETSSFVENDANINDEGIAALNASIPSHEIPMSTQTPSSTTETIELTAAEIDAELTNEAPPPPVAGNYDYGTNQASNLQTDWDNLDF